MPKQALIVDDSKSACRFLAKLLAEHDVASESVHSAEEALEYLRDKKPDVIFLDHNMPGMDGLETVKIIKSNPATATIPVLMYTTQEGEVYLGQARALGAVDVLSKDSVHQRLEESLARLGMGGTPPAGPLERRRRAPTEPPDWEALLLRMQSELSRQMYLILTEEQIAQKGQMRWLAGNIKGNLEAASEELLRRLEAKQDLYWEAQRAQSRSRFRVVTALLALLALLAVSGFWRQQQRIAALEERIAADAGAGQRRFEELRALLKAPLPAPAAVTEPAPTVPAPSTPPDAARLKGAGGAMLGRLLGTTAAGGAYEGVSDAGYLFSVDARGAIGFALRERYFAQANCVGDPLVAAPPGLVWRDAGGQLWYTAFAEPLADVQPLSLLDVSGDCQPVETEIAALRLLLPNDAAVTGVAVVDEPVTLSR